MKGVTKLIRDLGLGETVEVTGTARDNLYRFARQSGIKIKVEKFVNGFYVTNIGHKTVTPVHTSFTPTGNPLTDFIAKAQAKKGIVPVVMVSRESMLDEYPEAEEWVFTSKKVDWPDNGKAYREQHLVSNSKQTRTVEVDIDNPDEVVRVI